MQDPFALTKLYNYDTRVHRLIPHKHVHKRTHLQRSIAHKQVHKRTHVPKSNANKHVHKRTCKHRSTHVCTD